VLTLAFVATVSLGAVNEPVAANPVEEAAAELFCDALLASCPTPSPYDCWSGGKWHIARCQTADGCGV